MADASDQRPAPSATGTLAQRPLAHVLVYARNKRLTGSLELHAPDGRHASVSLWRGRIAAATTSPAVAYFGAVAYELGVIDTATLDATLLEVATKKKLHGEILVERGAITPAQRDDVLAEQTCRKVHSMFTMPDDAAFAFYDARASASEPPLSLDPIAPVWRGLRERPPTESVREVLSRLAQMPLRLVNEGPVGKANFAPEEVAVCEALTWRPMTIGQLRATSQVPASRVDLLVYLLIITKCLEPAPDAQQPQSQPPFPAAPSSAPGNTFATNAFPPPPPSSRPDLAPPSRPPISGIPGSGLPSSQRMSVAPTIINGPPEPHTSSTKMPAVKPGSGEVRTSLSFRVPSVMPGASRSMSPPRSMAAAPTAAFGPADLGAAGIAHRASGIDKEDLFEVLGLTHGAPDEAVRAAFFRLAKLWHPDRLPPDLAPFRSEVEKIFDHMAQAHRTLTDPDARKEWLSTRVTKQRPRKDVIRDIEQALVRREFNLVEEEAKKLTNADPDDAEAYAFTAWAQSNAGEAGEETLRAALPLLDKAVLRDRDCERALFYRGMFHKRLGNLAAAFRDFTRVQQFNPRHVDAQRELRILEMRARKGSGEHALDALIKGKKK